MNPIQCENAQVPFFNRYAHIVLTLKETRGVDFVQPSDPKVHWTTCLDHHPGVENAIRKHILSAEFRITDGQVADDPQLAKPSACVVTRERLPEHGSETGVGTTVNIDAGNCSIQPQLERMSSEWRLSTLRVSSESFKPSALSGARDEHVQLLRRSIAAIQESQAKRKISRNDTACDSLIRLQAKKTDGFEIAILGLGHWVKRETILGLLLKTYSAEEQAFQAVPANIIRRDALSAKDGDI
ncbi:hypothetical protein K438DRAFT_1790259 [Mycena galopus ATCC 62051]|nr:hypothetical protein K438DRAFT_1790259 [Mycena galopus ATCC 62051]